MDKLRSVLEHYGFGVCQYLASKMGIRSSRVRLYFIYISFMALGSPLIIYLVIAFWLNVKDLVRRGANIISD